MFQFQMEMSIIDSIKLPSVSVSKIYTYMALPDESLRAESCHFGMISASWTDKHISVHCVYFLVIIAILGISTPLHHKEKCSLISI